MTTAEILPPPFALDVRVARSPLVGLRYGVDGRATDIDDVMAKLDEVRAGLLARREEVSSRLGPYEASRRAMMERLAVNRGGTCASASTRASSSTPSWPPSTSNSPASQNGRPACASSAPRWPSCRVADADRGAPRRGHRLAGRRREPGGAAALPADPLRPRRLGTRHPRGAHAVAQRRRVPHRAGRPRRGARRRGGRGQCRRLPPLRQRRPRPAPEGGVPPPPRAPRRGGPGARGPSAR